MLDATCSVAPCDRSVHARGFCPAHYRRWRLYGHPLLSSPPRQRLVPHGTDNGYNHYRCRCVDCSEAASARRAQSAAATSEYNRAYRAQHRDRLREHKKR